MYVFGLQHGFCEKRSWEIQLTELVEDLGKQLNEGHQFHLVLLDFRKDSDKVNQEEMVYTSHELSTKSFSCKLLSECI